LFEKAKGLTLYAFLASISPIPLLTLAGYLASQRSFLRKNINEE